MSRAQRRVAPQANGRKAEELIKIKELIAWEQAIVEGAKSAFWLALRRKVAERGVETREVLAGHEKMGPEQRAIWVDRFLRYEWFIQVVEQAPKALDILEEKFAKLKAQGDGDDGV